MQLHPGSRLGLYEVLAPLGTGGMGEVYRAHDTRLHRDVALKVLSPERLTDPVARVRFEREMAIVAKLPHPRICTLLDVGHEGDQLYFAMELLHGESLATRLDRAGAQGLPLQEALDIAVAMCEALAYAHRHGVVHRDVKPANVMLTPDGVKLLDFGVARLREPEAPVEAKAAEATAATATLSIVGTPAYMAPEHIDGQADHRADLFSLGAVLYEMLAGQRAFPGETSSDILGAVVRCAPPPLADVRPALPSVVSRLVHRCLQKNVDERWQSAADLGEALRWARDLEALPTGSARPSRHAPARTWGLVAGAAALAAVVAALALGRGSPAGGAAFYVDDIPVPDGLAFVPGQTAWSRDGSRVAVVTQHQERDVTDFRLWTEEPGTGRGWQLVDGEGPEHVTYPSWSPDGLSLTYFRDHKLVRLALSSKVPVVLAEAPDGRGTAWLDDDTILYAPEAQGDIWQIPAEGGAPAVAIRRQSGDLGVKFPSALGDGDVLYWAQRSTPSDGEIRHVSTRNLGASRTVVRSSTAGAYADGHLFFVKDNLVVSQGIERGRWVLTGEVTQVPADTGMGGNVGSPHVTAGGSVVGAQSVRRASIALTWVDRTGAALATVRQPAPHRTMALSPDGNQLIVESAAPGIDLAQLWLVDVKTGTPRHIVTDIGAMHPVWHPGMERLAFRASRGPGGSGAIYEYALNGRAIRTLVETPTMASPRPAAWLGDDRLLWWAADATGRFNGIFVRGADGQSQPFRTLRVGADVRGVALRPGGQGLAYWSNDSGVFEVYVDTFPVARRLPWKVSIGGGRLPRWSPDGETLYFVSDGAIHAVAMSGRDGGPQGVPQRLFAFDGADYDVHPDGRLLVQRRVLPETDYLRVFRNWSRRPATDSTSGR